MAILTSAIKLIIFGGLSSASGGGGGSSPFTMAAGAGSFVLAGEAMTSLVDYKLTAGVGAFALTGMAATLTAPVVSTTTFDAAHKFQQTLTNGALTVVNSVGSGNFGGVRSIASHATGKYYLEWHLDGTPGADPIQIGICNASQIESGAVIMGGGANNAGTNSSGSIVFNGGSLGTYGSTEVANDVIGMAIDVGAKLGWWRINGGLWNFTVGADPASGTGGFDISGVTGDLFFFADVQGTNSGTVNTGATGYAQTPPSGFGNW